MIIVVTILLCIYGIVDFPKSKADLDARTPIVLPIGRPFAAFHFVMNFQFCHESFILSLFYQHAGRS